MAWLGVALNKAMTLSGIYAPMQNTIAPMGEQLLSEAEVQTCVHTKYEHLVQDNDAAAELVLGEALERAVSEESNAGASVVLAIGHPPTDWPTCSPLCLATQLAKLWAAKRLG